MSQIYWFVAMCEFQRERCFQAFFCARWMAIFVRCHSNVMHFVHVGEFDFIKPHTEGPRGLKLGVAPLGYLIKRAPHHTNASSHAKQYCASPPSDN